jgi:hypothetical protein
MKVVHDSFLSTKSVPQLLSPAMLSMESSDSTLTEVVNCSDLWVTFNDACVLRATAAHSGAEAGDGLTSGFNCDGSVGGFSCPALATFSTEALGPAG